MLVNHAKINDFIYFPVHNLWMDNIHLKFGLAILEEEGG